jgi:CHRD domain
MKLLLASFALAAVLVACPNTMTTTFKATLDEANEVPPVTATTGGSGSVTATLDVNTKTLTVTGTYTGLTGAVTPPGQLASGAHIHGPAPTTANAGVLFDLTATAGATAGSGTISGSAVLTDAQITDLNNGQWYVNLHTVANTGGEIRGQLIKQ